MKGYLFINIRIVVLRLVQVKKANLDFDVCGSSRTLWNFLLSTKWGSLILCKYGIDGQEATSNNDSES